MSSSFLFRSSKNVFLIPCLKVLTLPAVFMSEGSLFHIFGPINDNPLCPWSGLKLVWPKTMLCVKNKCQSMEKSKFWVKSGPTMAGPGWLAVPALSINSISEKYVTQIYIWLSHTRGFIKEYHTRIICRSTERKKWSQTKYLTLPCKYNGNASLFKG